MITHSNQTIDKQLHTVTIRHMEAKVLIDRLTRLWSHRSDGAPPGSPNRETVNPASGRRVDTVIHRRRRASNFAINLAGLVAAVVVWTLLIFTIVQWWIDSNG